MMTSTHATHPGLVLQNNEDCLRTDDSLGVYLLADGMGDQLLANGVPKEQIPEKQFHTLTQAVGCGEPPVPDFNTVELNQGDLLLLCSDGLTDMLADNEIEAILAKGNANLNTLAGNMIDAANAKGGLDNIFVVLVRS